MNTTVLVIGIILLVIGIVMVVIGIIIHENNVSRHVPQQWYVWFLIIGGIVVAIVGGIMMAVAGRLGKKGQCPPQPMPVATRACPQPVPNSPCAQPQFYGQAPPQRVQMVPQYVDVPPSYPPY